MNAKLPFIVVLLATVVFFWYRSERPRTVANSDAKTTLKQGDSAGRGGTHTKVVRQNSNSKNRTASRLLTQAADALSHGQPLRSKARFKINLFGEELQAPGSYLHAGQGSRKSRLEFLFTSKEETIYFLQISDGRFFYSFRQISAKDQLESVDLRPLNDLTESRTKVVAGPRAWQSLGNLESLFVHLSSEFQFEDVRESKLGDDSNGKGISIPVNILTGRWKHQSLIRLLEGQPVDFEGLKSDEWWKYLPEQFPHEVEITLGADDRFPHFPYRIMFRQFKSTGSRIVSIPIVTLELFEVHRESNLPEEMFQVSSTNHESKTEFYVERVRQFTR